MSTSQREIQTFNDVITKLRTEQERKVDVVLPEGSAIEPVLIGHTTYPNGEPVQSLTTGLGFDVATGDAEVDGKLNGQVLPIATVAHGQIAEKAGIPKRYYDRMISEAPQLWRESVRTWWAHEPHNRLIRTFVPNGEPGLVRAFLSDRFRVLDNMPFVRNSLEAAQEHVDGRLSVTSCQIDADRIYLKLSTQRERATKRGEVIRQGIILSNSEVGAGKVKIQPWAEVLACLNGMVSIRDFGKVHLGGELDEGLLTRETITKRADAVWSEVRDFVVAALGEEHFDAFFAQIDAAGQVVIEGEIKARVAVANVVRESGLPSGMADDILEQFLGTYAPALGRTQWAMVQSVTDAAHRAPTYRGQVEAEEVGGKLLAMPGGRFTAMAGRSVTDKDLASLFAS